MQTEQIAMASSGSNSLDGLVASKGMMHQSSEVIFSKNGKQR